MHLKNTARHTLTAVAIAGLLGLTACGSGDQPAEQNTPAGQASESGQASPSQEATQEADTSAKPAGWTDTLDMFDGFPAEWQDGAGWKSTDTAKGLFALGDYLVYQPAPTGNEESRVLILDGKGDAKVTLGLTPDEFKSGEFSHLTTNTATKDGKVYLVVIEDGKGEGDPTSVQAAEDYKSIVTVYNEAAEKVWSKSVPNQVSVANDAIVVRSGDEKKPDTVLDLVTAPKPQ